MPTKISNLPTAGALTGAETFPLVQTGVTKKTLLSVIGAWIVDTFEGFLAAGTGAVARTLRLKLRDWVSAKDFGTLGAGNDAAIFQAALTAVQGTSASLIIPGNTTIQLVGTGVTSAGAVKVVGIGGKDRTFITWTDTTMTAWAHTGNQAGGLIIEGITFSGPLSCTAGGAISVNGLGGVACAGVNIKDCAFVNGYRQLYMPQAHSWEITGNTFTDYVECALYTANTITTAQDEGDAFFSNNGLFGSGAAAKGIVQAGAGGLKVIGNKFYGGQYGYYMDLDNGVATSILIIQGNSIEFQTHSGIRLRNTAGGASFTQIIINGNQFASQPTPINLDHATSCFVAATISDNIIGAAAGAGTTAAITVTTTPLTKITDNVIYGTGTTVLGISVGSGSFATSESSNEIYGCVTEVLNNVSNGVAAALEIVLPTWTDVIIVTAGTATITSIAAASNHRNRTVTLVFQGVVTFTDGNNLLLAGNFVTSQHDTITLCCADGVNWYEVCRSVN